MTARLQDWPSRYAARISPRPQTFVLQPTSFCNLDCTYCYLPHRDRRSAMPVAVAEAVARSVAELVDEQPAFPAGVVWHAGEPLALGLRRFRELVAPFEPLRRAGQLRHYIQTNATLVTPAWCEFLTEFEVRVGVSIDGPEAINTRRVDRKGRAAFGHIIRGIDRLREYSIPFSVIAVVTHGSIAEPEMLLEFLRTLGCDQIGLNIEEAEGINTSAKPPTREEATEFWRRVLAWSRQHGGPTIRELGRLADYLQLVRGGHHDRWAERRIDPIPTISAEGEVVLLSPELAGTIAPVYNDFRAGNVLEQSIAAMLTAAPGLRYVREFLTGLDECEATCEFFDFCRGAQAGNRYFENGSLATTETNYCRVSQQALVLAVSDTVREEQSV